MLSAVHLSYLLNEVYTKAWQAMISNAMRPAEACDPAVSSV